MNEVKNLSDRWGHVAKLKALDFKFYQGHKWEPKEGDLYCITRFGLTLCKISKVTDSTISIQTIFYDDKSRNLDFGDHEIPREEFIHGGFSEHRVFVPDWALE